MEECRALPEQSPYVASSLAKGKAEPQPPEQPRSIGGHSRSPRVTVRARASCAPQGCCLARARGNGASSDGGAISVWLERAVTVTSGVGPVVGCDRCDRVHKIQPTLTQRTSNRGGVACGPLLRGTESNPAFRPSTPSPRRLPQFALETLLRAGGFVQDAAGGSSHGRRRSSSCRLAADSFGRPLVSASAAHVRRARIAPAGTARRPTRTAHTILSDTVPKLVL